MNYGLYGKEGKAMSVMRNRQNDCGNEWRNGGGGEDEGNREKRGNATNRTEQSPPTAVAGKKERFSSSAPPLRPARLPHSVAKSPLFSNNTLCVVFGLCFRRFAHAAKGRGHEEKKRFVA
ncbi:hypothetical protein niasHS_010153 [Heterodera schachtii]|uniref:Uncharacterized protein n=1 Tax=Heterodera schachtii TaxID=97005 RepID=A0ABD2IYV2_HETSC